MRNSHSDVTSRLNTRRKFPAFPTLRPEHLALSRAEEIDFRLSALPPHAPLGRDFKFAPRRYPGASLDSAREMTIERLQFMGPDCRRNIT